MTCFFFAAAAADGDADAAADSQSSVEITHLSGAIVCLLPINTDADGITDTREAKRVRFAAAVAVELRSATLNVCQWQFTVRKVVLVEMRPNLNYRQCQSFFCSGHQHFYYNHHHHHSLLSFALGHQSGVQRNSTLHHMLEGGCSCLSDLVHHLLPEKSEQFAVPYIIAGSISCNCGVYV